MSKKPHKFQMTERSPNFRQASSRLQVERLECRRLMAGLNVWVTLDGAVTGEQASLPAMSRIVYIDLNHDGQIGADEPTAVTDALGHAFFEGLDSGNYSVGLLSVPDQQVQLSPAIIEQDSTTKTPVSSQWLLGGQSGAPAWGLSADGILSFINGEDGQVLTRTIQSIGGIPQAVIQRTPTEAWISYKTASQSRIAIFDTNTRSLSTFYVSNVDQLIDLASDGKNVFGIVKGPSISNVVKIERAGASLLMTQLFKGNFTEVESFGNGFALLRQTATSRSLNIIDQQGTVTSSINAAPTASNLTVDWASKTIAVDTNTGVLAFRASAKKIVKVATIAEATGPLAVQSGRLLSSNRTLPGQITLWNMVSWQPESRFQVAATNVRDLSINADFQALALSDGKLHDLNLKSAVLQQVKIDKQDVEVRFSVSQLSTGTPPDVQSPQIQSLDQNQSLQVDLRQLILDSHGQTLWYAMMTGPSHGAAQLSTAGLLSLTPAVNYFGDDSLVIRVYNGQSATDVAISLQVNAINHPPTEMKVQLGEISEDSPINTLVGTVQVIDSDKNDSYQIVSSDPRFRLEGDKIYLAETLDYEVDSSIAFQLRAVDQLGQFNISTDVVAVVKNVLETPEGAIVDNLSIPENQSEVLVGQIHVIGADASGKYIVTVDDSRFEVRGSELWLVKPLNYEQERNLKLTLTVQDTVHPSIELVSTPNTITIKNVNDPPTAILLASNKVETQTPGAIIGSIAVQDEDGDTYAYAVSDDRFVVIDGVLQLTDNATLNTNAGASIALTITAIAANGNSLTTTLPLTVIAPKPKYQNPLNGNDVDGDGKVTPTDALIIINYLNKNGSTLPNSNGGSGEPPIFIDVNGDGKVTPLDVLTIINYLNKKQKQSSGQAEGEGESEESFAANSNSKSAPYWLDGAETRRANSKIDAELERILEQLAVENQRSIS